MSSRTKKRQEPSSGLSRRQQHNADQRRSTNAVGLTDFSQKKGQIRALEEFKKRKNKKNLETSMALRKYRKVMKQEGMEAGTGASRKRRAGSDGGSDDDAGNDEENNRGGSDDDEEVEDSKSNSKRPMADQSDSDERKNVNDDEEEEEGQTEQKQKKKKQTKPKKMDPFQKSREKAKLSKQRAEEAVLNRASNEKERQQKLKRRKQQTKLLQQRTNRGQPIMKHAINNLLYKLENQNKSNDTPARTSTDDQRRRSKNRDFAKPKQTQNDPQENISQKKKKRSRKFY